MLNSYSTINRRLVEEIIKYIREIFVPQCQCLFERQRKAGHEFVAPIVTDREKYRNGQFLGDSTRLEGKNLSPSFPPMFLLLSNIQFSEVLFLILLLFMGNWLP